MERTLLVKSSRASVDIISMSSMVVAFSVNFWRQSSAKFSARSHPSVDFRARFPSADCSNASGLECGLEGGSVVRSEEPTLLN